MTKQRWGAVVLVGLCLACLVASGQSRLVYATSDPRAKLDASLRTSLAMHERLVELRAKAGQDAEAKTRLALWESAAKQLKQSLDVKWEGSQPGAYVLLRTRDEAKSVAELGIKVGARIGEVATAYVPFARLLEVAGRPAVVAVQASQRLKPSVDLSVPETGAPLVWNTQHTTGEGALVAIIDSGIDPFHPDFIRPDGTTRIKAMLDLSNPGDTDSDGEIDGEVYGGTVYTEDMLNADLHGGGVFARMTGEPIDIPDEDTIGINSSVRVDQAVTITSVSVDLSLYHTWIGDLSITLRCPSGTVATLHNHAGGSNEDILRTFQVTACNGQSAQGEWTLRVADTVGGDEGTLNFWGLHINRQTRMTDYVGHGTHVAGIAAGNGRGTGNGQPSGVYRGMAPGADLIIVRGATDFTGGFGSAQLVNAMAWVDHQAEVLGRPYVINMSLGGHVGPHDGSSLEELTVDTLTGPGKPGKAIVVAAGNNGDDDIHASGKVSPGGTATLAINIPRGPALFAADIWYSGSDTFSLGFRTPGGTTRDPVPVGPEVSQCYDDYNWIVCIDHYANDPHNNDKNIFVIALTYASGHWDILLHGAEVTQGHYDAWLGVTSARGLGWVAPDSRMRVAMPGSARQAITVGSYVTRNSWTDAGGTAHSTSAVTGNISLFSSDGPTRDGRGKPDLAAPGELVCSTASAQASVGGFDSVYEVPADLCNDGQHGVLRGTSMATPHVTGAVALLQALNPNLDAAQLKTLLTQTTRREPNMGSVPNNRWGYGKLNVKAAADLIRPGPAATPVPSPTLSPPSAYRLFAPSIHNRPAPPILPNLNPIVQRGGDQYDISWMHYGPETVYILTEATDPAFTNAVRTAYRGVTSVTVTKTGRGRWYYRVQACSAFTCSDPSITQVLVRDNIRLYSAADATVLEQQPTRNTGSTIDMIAGYDDDVPFGIVRALVGFDLSSIPADAVISRAELSLYLVERYDYPNRTRTLTVHRVTSGWTESGLTWNTQPSFGEQVASLAIPTSQYSRYNLDITALVRAWRSGAQPNYGLMLRGPETSGDDSAWMGFGTREDELPYRPYLRLEYATANKDGGTLVTDVGDAAVTGQPPHQGGPSLYQEIGRPTRSLPPVP